MVSIIEANTHRLKKQFVLFQNKFYEDCPQYIPTLVMDEMQNLNEKKNPAFDYCEMKLFLAMRGKRIVGRVGAFISHKANEIWHRKRVRITRLDFIDDPEVSSALIAAVEEWGKSKGMTEISGPLGFCDLDKEGMLVDGFDRTGMFITYYNYPYYVDHMNRLGFEKDVDWTEHKVYTQCKDEEKLERICSRVKEKYGLNSIYFRKRSELKPYINDIFALLNSEYEKLYGVVPLSQKHIDYYAGMFITLINLEYIGLVTTSEGKVIAMGILAPGFADCMRKIKGHMFPFGWIELLKTIKHPKFLDMYFIAVDSDYRTTGAAAVLLHDITARAVKNGIEYAETGPQLELNSNIQMLFSGYEVEREIKRRRCWKKAIAK